MKTILVPLDFSDVTPMLLNTVKQLAQSFKSRIFLLHVAAYATGVTTPAVIPVSVETSVDLRMLQKLLDRAKECFAGSSLEVKTILIDGGIAAANILAESKSLHADLIVMGSHGHGALYNLLVGNVTGGVIKAATCPVLVVPSPRGKFLAAA
ncbi:MAG TPA: universal stress protein [Chthoniobacteraceae bacterium]|nr:universal stress protein [Chthoniobacteraceae bacterium]